MQILIAKPKKFKVFEKKMTANMSISEEPFNLQLSAVNFHFEHFEGGDKEAGNRQRNGSLHRMKELGIFAHFRDVISVGAVGAAAPTDFEITYFAPT